MGQTIRVTERTVDFLQQIRSNVRHISQKQQKLHEINDEITSDEDRIERLLQEYEEVQEETGGKDQLDAIKQVGSELKKLDSLKVSLAEDLSNHKASLLFFRERLEDEIWLALVQSGQVRPDDDISDSGLSPHRQSMEDSCHSINSHHDVVLRHNDPDAGQDCTMNDDSDTTIEQMRKAMSLLEATKNNVRDVGMRFRQLDRLCEAQRRDFEDGIVPEWQDMTRTEFDLEQLALRMDLTRELVEAEKAYSDAGRFAVEVGYSRDDSNQSCHFVDDPDDGACSGDRYVTLVEEKGMDFIESWRKGIAATISTSPGSAQGDDWDVDSVNFGEGCSTHADEWYKPKIERWEDERELERMKWHRAGIVARPDTMVCDHTSVLDHQGLPEAVSSSVSQYAETDSSRAGLWKPSLALVKELVVTGHAAVSRFSATWSTR
ncbi:hypothetical protein GJ744_004717 [Endocarpon pusillum]|uniref:Uncharacterized protein n=1 Tax=Endocarpon pusillum TaxID=364733 RepID=A0A8H7A5H2_9EURO|nr:hypothetical protein GJ744_004717 [Endocarpon pusillum]